LKGDKVIVQFVFACRSIWLHNLNSNKRCECVFGEIGCKPVLLLLWMFWIWSLVIPFFFIMIKLVWWPINHICCVRNVLKLQWPCEIFCGCKCPKSGLGHVMCSTSQFRVKVWWPWFMVRVQHKHYEKSHTSKPHYTTIKIQKTTQIQLLCNYPLGITTIVQLSL
jgi:hypothetical protein